jgi:uroporphyrinogen-III synthase
LAAVLQARGIAALIEPLLEIRYRDMPSPDLTGIQAVLCTSANGVRALAGLTGERSVPLFAVGTASAAEARAAGFFRVESADGNAGDLARLVRERLSPTGGRLLHITGEAVAGDLAGVLRAHGFAVDRATLYEACAVAALSAPAREALAAAALDFALFFSPRTAAIFARLVGGAGLAAALRAVTAVSISVAADAVLDPLPFRSRAVAERPDQTALLAALDQQLGIACGG